MYLFYTFQLFVYKFTNTKENWVFHDYEFEMSFLFFPDDQKYQSSKENLQPLMISFKARSSIEDVKVKNQRNRKLIKKNSMILLRTLSMYMQNLH